MTGKIIAAVAFSLALGASALAQSGGGDNTAGGGGAALQDQIGAFPRTWEGPIGDAFYSDTTSFTLRSQDEIAANWNNLTAEQQAQVRNDCQTFTTQSDSATDNTQTGSVGADGGSNFATAPSTTELCSWVSSM